MFARKQQLKHSRTSLAQRHPSCRGPKRRDCRPMGRSIWPCEVLPLTDIFPRVISSVNGGLACCSLGRPSIKMSFWKTGLLLRRTKSPFPSTFFARETMKRQPPAAILPAPVSKPAWEGQPGDLPIVFFGPHWHRIDFRSSWMVPGWQSR